MEVDSAQFREIFKSEDFSEVARGSSHGITSHKGESMNAIVLHQIVGSLGLAIENLMATKRLLEELLPKDEPTKEKVEDKNAPLPPEDHDEAVVDLDDDDEREATVSDDDIDDMPKKKSSSSTTSRPKISLDGKVSFSFEGTISVRE